MRHRKNRSDEDATLLEVILAMAVIAGASALGAGVALVSGQAASASAQRLEASEVLASALAGGASSTQVTMLGTTFSATVDITAAPDGTLVARGTVTWKAAGGTTDQLQMIRDEVPNPGGTPPLVVGGGSG
jgi:type II secretory pathway pseudopilin PulG